MGFLDNSGDIILDAVLTDTGRQRLARGDGSFRVAYFCLGDDEVDYTLFDTTAETATQDANIVVAPVLEALTDSRSSLKYKLMTLPDVSQLHLPVLRLNELDSSNKTKTVQSTDTKIASAAGSFVVVVDDDTLTSAGFKSTNTTGVMHGRKPAASFAYIRVDTGYIDSEGTLSLRKDHMDTEFMVQIDDRLGTIVQAVKTSNPDDASFRAESPKYIDSNNIATYILSGPYVKTINTTKEYQNQTPITGEKGTELSFALSSRLNLANSDKLFEKLGNLSENLGGGGNFKTIDSIVRVTGMTSKRSIDIPVKFIKQ